LSRDWDKDPSRFHEVHCAVGYLKRPIPQGYGAFVAHLENISLNPIAVELDCVTLVHHKYRSLAFPQEGMVSFPLGKRVELDSVEFASRINFA